MKFYIFVLGLILPNLAFAYLDPGTGNALIYLLLTIGGAFVYFFKRIFYIFLKLIRKDPYELNKKQFKAQLTIFSEGKTYYYTFKQIIEELIARKIYFRYLTTDLFDPALTIYSPYMDSKYVGKGQRAYAKIGHSAGKFFLATTPNIGCKGYPLHQPKRIDKMLLISHAVSDLSYLKLGSIDHYDIIMDIGNWCKDRVQKVIKARNLKDKIWLAVGLPYLDELSKHVQLNKREDNCILVAPSWGKKGFLSIHGTDCLIELLKQNYKIIFRPHPQAWKNDLDILEPFIEKASQFDNFTVDRNLDATESMNKASILISDSSSIRYDFAFLYKRPVITMEVPKADLSSFEASILGGPWDEGKESLLGAFIDKGKTSQLLPAVNQMLSSVSTQNSNEKISNLYDELIVNHSHSAKAIVDYMVKEGLN